MTDDEDTDLPSVLPGTSWDNFFEQCDSRTREKSESPVKQNNEYFSDFVSRMPYQKATCFGVAPLDNARYLRLMKCNQCNKILKHVGFAHHMRRRHLCNSYDQNGNNSGDEAPDFLLSPPYTSNSSTSIYKQPSTSTNPLSYVSEKRDGLLLVLKRARVPSTSDKNHTAKQSDDEEEAMLIEKEEEVETSVNEDGNAPIRQRRTSKSQRLSISRPSESQNQDCVAFRTRHRQPETQYVELPTYTRHQKTQQQLSIPKITVSRSVKNNSVASNQNSTGSPNSVIILDDDSLNKNDEEEDAYGESNPVEFSFVLPENHETVYATDEISRSRPTTNATSSSRSSSIQSINAPPSKTSRSSSKRVSESPRMYNIMNVEEEQYVEEEHTPQSSSMDYQNDNSLPSSSSPEMPQLEREDLYAPDDGASDSNQEMNVYPNNSTVSFPAGTLVFTPVNHHQNQYHQQHQVYNGNHVHPVNTFVINPPPASSVANQQQPPASNGQQNGQPIAFFYNPATVNSEPPQKSSFTLNQQLLRQQQARKRQRAEVVPARTQQQQMKRKMTVVGTGTQLKATSIHPYYQHQIQQQHPHQNQMEPHPPPRRRILVSTGMSAQQLARLQAQSKANNMNGTNRPAKLPPPIIISNPNTKRPNMLQQRNRNYSPVVMNCLNNRPHSSPSSANSSSFSSNSSAKSVENSWFNNIQFSNEFLYYNEPSVQTQHDLWKSSKSFHST